MASVNVPWIAALTGVSVASPLPAAFSPAFSAVPGLAGEKDSSPAWSSAVPEGAEGKIKFQDK